MALTAKQKRFVEEFAGDGNATQAYFRAFGRHTSKGKKRSYGGASEQARRLLQIPEIAAEVESARSEYKRRVRVDKTRVLREVSALAHSDLGDLFEEDPDTGMPKPIPWGLVAPAARRAIQSVKIKRRIVKRATSDDDLQEEIEEVEYKLHPKGAELDRLCKKLGFYADKADAPKEVGVPVEMLTRLIALAGAHAGGVGGDPQGPAVDAESGAAEPGVPE